MTNGAYHLVIGKCILAAVAIAVEFHAWQSQEVLHSFLVLFFNIPYHMGPVSARYHMTRDGLKEIVRTQADTTAAALRGREI